MADVILLLLYNWQLTLYLSL